MDENEITTVADTQAEKISDTADTGQTTPTTEELIRQLTARVAALEEIVGEEEYELRHSPLKPALLSSAPLLDLPERWNTPATIMPVA
jgi:hypothetical protein